MHLHSCHDFFSRHSWNHESEINYALNQIRIRIEVLDANLHAAGERVLFVVIVQFDFIGENAFPLGDAELSCIVRCVRLFH